MGQTFSQNSNRTLLMATKSMVKVRLTKGHSVYLSYFDPGLISEYPKNSNILFVFLLKMLY